MAIGEGFKNLTAKASIPGMFGMFAVALGFLWLGGQILGQAIINIGGGVTLIFVLILMYMGISLAHSFRIGVEKGVKKVPFAGLIVMLTLFGMFYLIKYHYGWIEDFAIVNHAFSFLGM